MKRLVLFLLAMAPIALWAQADSHGAERELVRLTNEDRGREHLTPLERNNLLQEAARAHLQLMVKEHKLSHQFSGEETVERRIAATGLRFQSSGENVAFFTDYHDEKQNAEEANEILMRSPPHRENILKTDYNAIGVAIASDGRDVWVVEDFSRAFPSASAADAEHLVEAAIQDARASHSLPPVKLSTLQQLRAYACRSDATPVAVLHDFPDARAVNVYTTWELRELSQTAMKHVLQPGLRNVADGVCAVDGPESHGNFRVVMMFF